VAINNRTGNSDEGKVSPVLTTVLSTFGLQVYAVSLLTDTFRCKPT